MFPEEEARKVLQQNQLPRPVAEKLLNLYVADIDWWPHIERLYIHLLRKNNNNKNLTAELVRKSISFTILLPAVDRTFRVDEENPQNMLFRGMRFDQFNDKDWFEEIQKVVKKNQEITGYRRQALSLGIIDPIDYQPYTRQAFKWLCGEAEKSGVEVTPELKNKFRQLVMAYGGAVVSYIFENHQDAIRKITNWRSGYFFERAIFDVYKIDQVLKIKKAEMQKTNQKWIRQIRA